MNGDKRGILCAIRGPIMLITVGVLFAINNFTPYGFQWPVLLIVFGLLTLMGRSARPAAPQPPAQAWYPPAAPPPPYDNAAPGGYRQSTYSQPAADAPQAGGSAGTSKGGFGSSAPSRSSDPGQTPGGAV
jgi:hypothetical protein